MVMIATVRWGVTLAPMDLVTNAISVYLSRAMAATCAMGKTMGVVNYEGNGSRNMNILVMPMGHTGSMHIIGAMIPECRLRNRIRPAVQRTLLKGPTISSNLGVASARGGVEFAVNRSSITLVRSARTPTCVILGVVTRMGTGIALVAGLLGRGVNAPLLRRLLELVRAGSGQNSRASGGSHGPAILPASTAPPPASVIDQLLPAAEDELPGTRTLTSISHPATEVHHCMRQSGCDHLPGSTSRIKDAEEEAGSMAAMIVTRVEKTAMGHKQLRTVPTPPSAMTLTLEFEGALLRLGLAEYEEAASRLPVLPPTATIRIQFGGAAMRLGRRGGENETSRVQHSAPPLGRRPGCVMRESTGTSPTSTSRLQNDQGYGTSRRRRRLHNAWMLFVNVSPTESAPGEMAAAERATLAWRATSSVTIGRRSWVQLRPRRRMPPGTLGNPNAKALAAAT